ncbi:hypothetical protein CK203_078920 [Vitis vinifera]|uniref:MULE transposase domain-containing protein n=1 Tax=Vitis vinifera TaxID=29760 RepID=A0A438DA45_VITVI|nr:hypothetical protein CK203_078920 [Vitis vinifera]
MDESPLSLPGNSPSMPNVQAPQSQYDFIEADGQYEIVNVPIDVEDDEDDEDYNLSDFSESDDDIIEDFGMEDDGINRIIGGNQLEGVWNGEGDSDHGDSDELRSAEGSYDDEGNSRPRFPEFNQRIGMENVQLVKDQKFASHVIFKEALKEWCIKEKHDFEYKHNDKWRVTAGAVFRDHEVDVTLDQCYKAKRMAFKMIHGCRPLIGIDGCHLKGTTGGQLLVAVGKDVNDNISPIAFDIVEIENKSSWTWFLQCLLDDIGHVDENGWVFISDRQKARNN